MERGRPPKMIFSIECDAQLAYQAIQKIVGWKSLLFFVQAYSKSSEHFFVAPSALLG
jgi:hypothetical protein